MISYSLSIIARVYSSYGLLFLFTANLVTYLVQLVFNSKKIVWLSAVLIMWISNITLFEDFMSSKMTHLKRRDTLVEFMVLLYFMILRVIGFLVDKCDVTAKCNEITEYGLVNYLSYTFYPTFLFVSSFVPFKNFKNCVSYLTCKTLMIYS
jgi:hypothetical protein